ncbi:MAG: hypothetical protein WEC84_01050 [Candidatus Andersenbacteria bacterium]
MTLNTPQKITVAFLAFLFVFWVILFQMGTTTGFYNYLYSFLFGLIPLVGGAVAMSRAKQWGGLQTAIGKAVFFIGLGLLLWGSGETIWSYYNFFLGEPAPYPSLADLGFAPSIFFYGLGAIYLSKATGAKFGLRNKYAKLIAAIAAIVIFAISYYVLVIVARGGILVPEGETPLKIVLDIVYPLGDFLAFAIAAIVSGLSFRYMGGRYTLDTISILLGLFVMFVADSIFSYTTTAGTFYNGSFGDLMLTLGLFLLTFGVLGFYKLKEA